MINVNYLENHFRLFTGKRLNKVALYISQGSRFSLLFQLKEQIESNQSEFGAMQGGWMKTST